MSWTSLSTRLPDLPLVLAGPILRRVTANSVSIFVVTKESKTVEAEIMDENGNSPLTGAANTRALGQHLHVCLVTVDTSSAPLTANTIYQYDLRFDTVSMHDDAQPNNLRDGIIVNDGYSLDAGLAYPPFTRPTFVLPAEDIEHLRIMHGSCRKPHGGERDALSGLDHILETAVHTAGKIGSLDIDGQKEKANLRPQQIYLTGDQVYADDVADALLRVLIDASDALLGWPTSEVLPDQPATNNLQPGNRLAVLVPKPNDTKPGGISSAEGASHLIHLGEFYAMYIGVWSNVLYDSELPIFEQTYGPGVSRTVTREIFVGSAYAEDMTAPTVQQIEVPSKKWEHYVDQKEPLETFIGSLPQVRRVLANIPSYMMFDDHEVTDDWFLSREWTANALLPGHAARRTMQNGLASFTIFQAWGNTPDLFAPGQAGMTVLNRLEELNTGGGAMTNPAWLALGNQLLPTLDTNGIFLTTPFHWNFHLDFPLFRAVVLDTRTQRSFQDEETDSGLIQQTQLEPQLRTSEPRPAGMPEEPEVVFVISPAPIFGNPDVENRVQKVGKFFKGVYFFDFEAWVFHEETYERLLDAMSNYPRVVILSGDVHYAFSGTTEYWNDRPGNTRKAIFAQLCSSPLKNSDFKTNLTARWNFLRPSQDDVYVFAGWQQPGHHVKTNVVVPQGGNVEIGVHVDGTPPKVEWRDGYRLNPAAPAPIFKYRMKFDTDIRPEEARDSPTAPVSGGNADLEPSRRHRNRFEWDSHRIVVGKDNIGMVTFTKDDDDVPTVHHQLIYFSEHEDAGGIQAKPFTIHSIALAEPTGSPL